MPIYEYLCPKCGPFEAIQSFSDKPLTCKPDCEDKGCPKKAERLISASAFHLKGSGWYKTDYSSSSSSGSTSGAAARGDSASSKQGSDGAASGSGEKKEASALSQASCGTKCGCH
jgi:putative FmdB family regulatory protein